MVMHVELQATCSALGYLEGNKYIKEPDCLETVKDLIRFLKREDETCDIRRQLGHAGIVQNDLLQLFKYYKDDAVLFDTVLRLMVNLSQPAYLCFNNQIPEDKTLRNYYLEIESHLYNYKEAFVDEELFAVLTKKIGDILKLDWENRQEEDKLTLERILILLRNVLHIAPDPKIEKRTDDDASLHDQIIWVFHVSGMEDMILYIASADDERQLCMHILEIISLMFREQKPEALALAGVKKSQVEKAAEERELEMIREQERATRKAQFLKQSTRHSRFGGTYVVKNMKSISEREMIYHKARGDIDSITCNDQKRGYKISKNRQPIKDKESTRRSTLSIRLSLKEFCIQFLENCYNPLMFAVKDNLVREKTQENDETYYLWSIRFFMEFCRCHSKRVELVSETMSTTTFHYIYNNLLTYYEMILTEKKEAKVWGRRAHLALKGYQELMLTLDSMDKSGNPQVMESAKVIKSNLFYMTEYRDIFVTLLRKFNESHMSRMYLKDLVESTHLFLKMLETWSKKRTVVVKTKKKMRKPHKPKEKKTSNVSGPSEVELEDMWDEVSGELSAIIQGREEIPTDVTPFDAASEVDVDQQRVDAMIRIQDCLREKKTGESMALFRAAREVWPERNEFGASDISAEEEFMAIREIFLAPLPRQTVDVEENEVEEEDGYNEIEEEEMECTVESEQQFDFKHYLNSLAKGTVMKSYGLLLADYETNSSHTNHCIIKMFHRVAVELGYIGMLFQAAIFRTFQKLMFGPYVRLPRYKEMVKFGTYLVHHFVQASDGNPKIFMEFLFWKSSPEAMDIIHGYGYTANNKHKILWTEEQEQEVSRLFEESRETADPEKDLADRIMERLTDPSKTRNQLIRQLKRQGLIENAAELKQTKRYDNTPWREEEELMLRNLYERYKDSDDPIGNMVASDSLSRSKSHIIVKLIELAIINDASQVKKKRKQQKKSKHQVEWEDEEETELKNLFQEHRTAEDPIGCIMLVISGKTKRQVIEKLLDVELIRDRSEVDKKYKKTTKKKTQKDVWGQYGEDEVLPDFSSSDEEQRMRRLNCTKDQLANIDKSDEDNLSDDGSICSDNDSDGDQDDNKGGYESEELSQDEMESQSTESSSNMTEVISEIIKNGYKDQIKWLQCALQKTATNREKNNSCIPIPVVPLTEDNENAMEDDKFLNFMTKVGFSPPSNEQEAFWRIPGELTPIELRNIVEGLDLNESDEPVYAHKIPNRLTQKKTKGTNKQKEKKVKEDKKKKNKIEMEKRIKERKDASDKKKKLKSKLEALKALKESRKRKRRADSNESHSESSDDDIPSKRKPSSKLTKKTRKIQKVMKSDSESEHEMSLSERKEKSPQNSDSESHSESSDDDIPSKPKPSSKLTKKTRKIQKVMKSDSESEHEMSLSERKEKSPQNSDSESEVVQNEEDDVNMSNTDYRLQLNLDSDDDQSQVESNASVPNNKDKQLDTIATTESFPAAMLSDDSDDDDDISIRKVSKRKIISSDED